MPSISPERFSHYRKQESLTQEEMGNLLGVTAKYVGMIERGEKQVEETSSLGLLFQVTESGARPTLDAAVADEMATEMIGAAARAAIAGNLVDERKRRRDAEPESKHRIRTIPVIGWAHAGEAQNYEQLPDSWVSRVPTECRDQKAFGVRLEGDSMESSGPLSFTDGDLLVAMPGEEAYSGCFVIARFTNDGVTFRRFETAGDVIRLVPLNDRYPVTQHTREEFSWIYPVWGRWSQLWKR